MHPKSSSDFLWLKIIAAILAIGLHAIVLAMALSKPVVDMSVGDAEPMSIQFVDLDMVADAEAPIPEPERSEEQSIEPEFEPFPVPEPEPEPEPVVEPEPEQPVVEPEPDDMVEEVQEKIKAEPKPVSPIKPEPKPAPKPEPKPVPKPVIKKEMPKPAAKPVASATNQTVKSSAKAANTVTNNTAPVDPDRPRSLDQASYQGRKPDPKYPRMSQRMGEQGRVILRVLISADGLASKIDIKKSSGHERLDKAAIEAVKKAKFRPYTENGIAYKALVDIPFDFIL